MLMHLLVIQKHPTPNHRGYTGLQGALDALHTPQPRTLGHTPGTGFSHNRISHPTPNPRDQPACNEQRMLHILPTPYPRGYTSFHRLLPGRLPTGPAGAGPPTTAE